MIELTISFLVTVLPDYLYRRFVHGMRLGQEITLFNVWYVLRWGLTAWGILAVTLITVILFFHPSTNNVFLPFRTVTILSERGGRVAEVYVQNNQVVEAGAALFRLDSSTQEAAANTARRRITEVDAALALAGTEVTAAQAQVEIAEADLRLAQDDYERRRKVAERNATVVSEQELERLQQGVDRATGAREAARALLSGAEQRLMILLPAQRETARSALAEAENEIAKSVIYASVSGTVQQFALQPGDIVNPILRPAGILVPHVTGQGYFVAAFGQITGSVVRPGMLVEITCATKPLTVIPMTVSTTQETIASGQFRPGDALVDLQDRMRPGTILAFLEPIYPEKAAGIQPGSACAGVAYTSRAAELARGEITGFAAFRAKVVDGMGIANAIVIRGKAILLPVKSLVFSG